MVGLSKSTLVKSALAKSALATTTRRSVSGAARNAAVHAVAPAIPLELAGIVHVLTCGSVDDGKSTLIGRLLWDTDAVADDQRASMLRQAGPGGEPDLSLLVDGLLAEREQGITIDIAWRYIDAGGRRLVIIDSPGHEQYTRNMASGASHADVAVMLVDARHGLKVQTRRHAAILDLVGVRRVVLAVNKMDLVDWSENRFREIEADFASLARTFGFREADAIPVSARRGDNVARRSASLRWYDGPTLLERLSETPSRTIDLAAPFRFPVQTVVRSGDFRGLAGTVASGRIAVGDAIIDRVTGRQARVSRIVTYDGDLAYAEAGRAVALSLDTDLDISRGAVLAASDTRLPADRSGASSAFEARLVWLADKPLEPGQRLLFRTATDLVAIVSLSVSTRLDLATLAEQPTSACATNDIVSATVELGRPAALDLFADAHVTGAFMLVDAITGATVAGGVVRKLVAAGAAAGAAVFRLTKQLLAAGVCHGLAPDDPEFERRAREVERLMQDAGIAARLDLAADAAA